MATTMTLLELRTAIRQRADMVNSTFVSDAELTSYINQSAFEYYDLLAGNPGQHFNISAPYSFTTDGINEFYALPADFYKMAGISSKAAGGIAYAPLKQASFQEMMQSSGLNNNIPLSGQTVKMFYIPNFVTLASDSDTLQGYGGWTEYVITDGAIKCLQKEESDVSIFATQKADQRKRVLDSSANRDGANPSRVSDVSQSNNYMIYCISGQNVWVSNPYSQITFGLNSWGY